LALAACGSEENTAVPSTPPPAPVETRAGAHGVTVVLPEGWHTMPTNDDQVSDPDTRVAVSSGPMRDRETCSQIADYGPEDDAVSLVIVEWQPSEDLELGPRPLRFTREVLPVDPGAAECFSGSGGTVPFTDRGRQFGAYILLGPDAPTSLADEARAVLQTLRVDPAAAN
jgi:hypothetical protein